MSVELKEPVAGVVLKDEKGRYLLVQEKQLQAYGLWNLPAGWIDPGESAQQAAIREAKEEVGFDVKLQTQEPVLSKLNNKGNRLLTSFYAQIVGGVLEYPGDEILAAKWFALEEIEGLHKSGEIRDAWVIESVRKVEFGS